MRRERKPVRASFRSAVGVSSFVAVADDHAPRIVRVSEAVRLVVVWDGVVAASSIARVGVVVGVVKWHGITFRWVVTIARVICATRKKAREGHLSIRWGG